MRPKFVFGLFLSALLVLGAIVFLKQHFGNVASAPTVATAPPPASNVAANAAPPPAPAPAPAVVNKTMTTEEREAAIEAEKDRLSAWAMNNDSASLSNILADLTSPEKEVRMAAIEAAEQFDSTNAIPVLKAVAANTEDTQEQIALLEAADFLSLPDVVFATKGTDTPKTPEQIQADQQRRAQIQARRQAQMQKRAGNQNPQFTPGQNQ